MTPFFAVRKKYKLIGLTVRFPVLTPEHPRRKVWNARQSGPFVWCDCGSPSVLFARSSAPYLNLLLNRANILNCSNKSTTRCNSFPVYYPDVYLQLNMFRAFSRPSSGAQWLQWQPLVLPSYRGDSRAVFTVEPAGPTTNTARLSPRYEGKTRGCHCSRWAPDDGRGSARNVLSCE